MQNHKESFSELRQDAVSGDWVVIATGRAKRPHAFVRKKKQWYQPKRTCPFENPQKSGNEDPVLVFYRDKTKKDWWLQVLPNKYPAFHSGLCPPEFPYGPYTRMEGVGFHEVVITRDHDRSFALLEDGEAEQVIRAYQERYLALMNEDCVKYISIIHNHGQEAGATIYHPHSQLIAIPVIPGDVMDSLKGASNYFKKHKHCVHCVMTDWERKEKKRIIYENESFIALCPFISRTAFEVVITPKTHSPHFEMINERDRVFFAKALRAVLRALWKGLKNPAYNYFIHTAPCEEKANYHFYHWHLELFPKTAIWAGFEIGTGIEISSIAPEDAAEFLKKQL